MCQWQRLERAVRIGHTGANTHVETGPLLDIHPGMKPVTGAITDGFSTIERYMNPAIKAKFHVVAEKSPRHVLVVDDEPLIRWSVAETLSGLGYDVEQASDATSALRLVTTTRIPFDVVVLDLRLPDMDDLSLLGTVRQLLPSALLILMTAFGTPEIMDDARSLGASVLNKPFELDQLTELVLHGSDD